MNPSIPLPQCILFMGRSGCGKGTQAKLLIEKLKKIDPARETLYVQTGQELREFIKGGTYTQKKTKELYDVGGLTPEFIAVHAWITLLVKEYKGNEHVVFDGSPRKFHEAGLINSIFEFYTFAKPHVVHIEISMDEAVRRLMARKRQDDGEAEIRRRLGWYETDVLPAIEYFKTNPNYNYAAVDGTRSVEEIHADIVKQIGLQ